MQRPRLLTFVDYYYPGSKAGGPVRSIQDLVAQLGEAFQFDIVTRDRDLGDQIAYPGVSTRSWEPCGRARVMYLPPAARTLSGWYRMLRRERFDLLYLNSVFSRTTIEILALRRFGLLPPLPCVVAPRGEFQAGALSVKAARKRGWMAMARRLQLYTGLEWQAATSGEESDIVRVMAPDGRPCRPRIYLAPQLPVRTGRDGRPPAPPGRPVGGKRPGLAKVVFLSRICRKKNLDYALRVLRLVRGRVEFDIYGPIEDRRYWRECLVLMKQLPAHISARYCGALAPEDVSAAFGRYDVFCFPTRGESFGHVVAESLLSGCPVLLSDQTPWRHLASKGAGWDLPLAEPHRFAEVLTAVVEMDAATLGHWSTCARQLGQSQGREPAALEANRRMFLEALGKDLDI